MTPSPKSSSNGPDGGRDDAFLVPPFVANPTPNKANSKDQPPHPSSVGPSHRRSLRLGRSRSSSSSNSMVPKRSSHNDNHNSNVPEKESAIRTSSGTNLPDRGARTTTPTRNDDHTPNDLPVPVWPVGLDRTQQDMIWQDLTIARQKLWQENQALRDELLEAKLVIRLLKLRVLQQQEQAHQQEAIVESLRHHQHQHASPVHSKHAKKQNHNKKLGKNQFKLKHAAGKKPFQPLSLSAFAAAAASSPQPQQPSSSSIQASPATTTKALASSTPPMDTATRRSHPVSIQSPPLHTATLANPTTTTTPTTNNTNNNHPEDSMESLNQWHELMLETMELAQHHQAVQHEKQQQQQARQEQAQQAAGGRRSLATTCLSSSLLPVSHYKASHTSNNNNNTNNNKRLQRQQAFANPLAAGPKLFQTQSSSSSWSHCTGIRGSEKADATATAEPSLEHKEPPFCARTPHATHSSTVALDPATTTTTPKKDKEEEEDDTGAPPHVHVHPDETQPADQPNEEDEIQRSLLLSPEPPHEDEEDDSVLDETPHHSSCSTVDGTELDAHTPETMTMAVTDPLLPPTTTAAASSSPSSTLVWSDSVRDVLDSVVSEALNGQDNDAAFSSSSLSHPTPKLPGSPGGGSDTSSSSSGIGPLMQLTTTSSSSSNGSNTSMERPEQEEAEPEDTHKTNQGFRSDPEEQGPTVEATTRTTENDDRDAVLSPSTDHAHRLVSV